MINPRPHKKLTVWQKAMDLVTKIYKITESFPAKEAFGLVSQLRRAAVSVPSNIAEGLTRKTSKDKLHFLNVAQASLSEIDTQIEISIRLGYIDQMKTLHELDRLTQEEKLLRSDAVTRYGPSMFRRMFSCMVREPEVMAMPFHENVDRDGVLV